MSWLNKKTSIKTILFVLLLVFFGTFFPLKPALAAWYDFLIGAVTFIPATLIAFLLSIAVLLTSALAAFSGVVLKWVLDPSFIQLPYTRPGAAPGGNPLIEIGLNITQPLANMILVLVLVFIALTTILRLAGYETKKLLPIFILIALLVNFSTVILGLIVDASNIVMSFFIKGITGGERLINQLKALGDTLYAGFKWATFFSSTFHIEVVLTLSVFIFLNISLFLVLLLWAIIFIARYMAIWLLVILSPIAFVCYILPATRRIWNLWWNQFIRWVLIGVNAVFFLYLADQFSLLTPPLVAPGTLGGAVLPYIFPVAIYWAGLIIAWAKLPAEVLIIKALTQRGGRWLGAQSLQRARMLTSQMLGQRGKDWMERQAAAPFMPQGIAQIQNRPLRWATAALSAPATATYWAVRRGIGEAGLKLTETSRANIRSEEKQFEGTTAERKAATLTQPTVSHEKQVAILKKVIDERQLGDVRNYLERVGNTADQINDIITRIGRHALRINPEEFTKIRDAFPHLAQQMGQDFSEALRRQVRVDPQQALDEGYASVMEMTMARLKASQISQMDFSQYYPDPDTGQRTQMGDEMGAAMRQFWTGEQVATAGKEFGRRFLDQFQADVNVHNPGWYAQNNPRLLQYLQSSTAQGLGLSPPP